MSYSFVQLHIVHRFRCCLFFQTGIYTPMQPLVNEETRVPWVFSRDYFSSLEEIFAHLFEGERVHASIRSLGNRFQGMEAFSSAERSRPMSFKRKWIVLVREIRLLFTLRFLLFRVKSRPLSRFKKILERILIFPFHFLFSLSLCLSKFSPLNIQLARLYPLRNLSME